MNKNVFAHTAPGASYPEYISVNETADPNLFTITVRSKATGFNEGATAMVTLTMLQMEELAGAIVRANIGAAA